MNGKNKLSFPQHALFNEVFVTVYNRSNEIYHHFQMALSVTHPKLSNYVYLTGRVINISLSSINSH
jgi:hypothetical protein